MNKAGKTIDEMRAENPRIFDRDLELTFHMIDAAKQKTDDALIAEYIRIDDFVKAETKRFGEHLAPHKARMEEIANQLLAVLNGRGAESTKCDSGTAYKSTLLNVKVEDREKLIDLVLEDWDARGDMLQVGIVKDGVRAWMDAHEGKPPDGTSISWFTRCNIRRS